MTTCHKCGHSVTPMRSFKCSVGKHKDRILCNGCFRHEEYDEDNRNPYTGRGFRAGTPKGPREVFG